MGFNFDRLRSVYGEFSHLSVIVLVLANLFPLYGVLFAGWQVFPLLFLYWLENLIIGVFNVLKMLTCGPNTVGNKIARFAVVTFFCIHYGMFTMGHGLFIFTMFGGVNEIQSLWAYGVGWAALELLVSHGISFGLNYIRGGEYKRTNLNELMQAPYGRVVIMHLTIIFGGMLVAALEAPVGGLIALVIIKIIIDLKGHTREHFKGKPEEIVIPAKG